MNTDDIAPGKRRKYTIMRKLKILECSAVDRPAQAGARAVIMKRADHKTTTSFKTNKYSPAVRAALGLSADSSDDAVVLAATERLRREDVATKSAYKQTFQHQEIKQG
jgi:hypothetical protein